MTLGTAAEVQLHHEIRGDGPAILLVPGLPGDGSQFDALADRLATDHTVITYDRRGNSRSTRPPDWYATSIEEQAADAAALLELLRTPALVYGSSVGAIVALEVARTRPELATVALLHEMPLLSVLADSAPIAAAIGEILEPAFARGGPNAALEAFLRFAFGDATISKLSAEVWERMLSNGEVAMGIEMPVFQAYHPNPSARAPVAAYPLVGREQALPFFEEAASRLAQMLGTRVVTAPGAHGAHIDRPDELAALIRDLESRGRQDA